MKNYTRILTILSLALLTFVMSATAQTNDDKNKAIVETTDGIQQLNTDEISIIRFEGDKVTFVQPWGESVFDRTLRSLTFLRPLPGTLRLTVNAGINENQGNRAQEIDGDGKLKTTWESGDVVYVYADAVSTTPLGTLTPASEDYGKSTATLEGDITGTGLADGTPTLYFSTQPRATYSLATQNGTVGSLFYCTATASVTINGGNATISGTLDFNRPISVVKFKLMDKGNSNAAINADKLVVTVDGNSYTVTPTSPTDELFVGIPIFSSKTVYLTANEGSTVYTYEKASISFAENKYYAINVKMSYNALSTPLNFEAKADGFTVTLTSTLDPLPSLEYSIDGGAWTAYTCNNATPSVNKGHTISFRGNNSKFINFTGEGPQTSNFFCSKDCYLYGNIMSLLNASGYATATSVGEQAFIELFNENGHTYHIYSHNTKELVLPATTLATNCYAGMFLGCTALTRAPELPATTLASGCYQSMFNGCTALTVAPELPATTLASMCYTQMFYGCTNLNSVTCLATNISAENCTYNWLDGVAATGTFTAYDKNVGWTINSESGIPSGWARENKHKIVNLASLTGNCVAQNNDILTGTLGENHKITVADGATVTLDNASINADGTWTSGDYAGITCLGDATIILSGTNTVKGFCNEYSGIYVPEGYTLTIQGTGSLTASSNGKATGIGAAKNTECGNISISGGTIIATGGEQAAGIGGCSYGDCGNITISGGSITATGGDDAAGIGSGEGRICGNITISRGVITATGGDNAAGIGTGGTGASCGNISISGGAVTATGGSKGAGIGTGKGLSCGSITITSGVTSVTATKGSDATNSIGVGYQGTCGMVTIGGTEYWKNSAYVNDGSTYLTQSSLMYPVLFLSGKFSVASGKQIQFSRGNLQYTRSTATWSFMPRQYGTVETNSDPYCTENYGNKDVVSLFGWGTSGQNHGSVAYQPYSTSTEWNYYDAYGNRGKSLYESDGKADWGYNMGTGWRTPTQEEWVYLLRDRWDASYKWGLATVVGVTGLVILPDSWSLPDGCTFTSGYGSAWTTNSYDADKWSLMEAAGAVFLPAAGVRYDRRVSDVGSAGNYWCSSVYSGNDSLADDLEFYSGGFSTLTNSAWNKPGGLSVRLVKDAN